MNFTFTKTKKYVVLAFFLAAAILSLVFMRNVSINYNISDYLDESTETKISLGILNEEFGATQRPGHDRGRRQGDRAWRS